MDAILRNKNDVCGTYHTIFNGHARCSLPHSHHVVCNIMLVRLLIALGLCNIIKITIKQITLNHSIIYCDGINWKSGLTFFFSASKQGTGFLLRPFPSVPKLRKPSMRHGFTFGGEKLLHQALLVRLQGFGLLGLCGD